MIIKPDFYMLFGFRNFPVNPNDYLPDIEDSEADNPMMFQVQESAEKIAEHLNSLKDFEDEVFKITIGGVYLK